MVLADTLGGSGSLVGASQPSAQQSSNFSGPVWEQEPFMQVTVDGTPLDSVTDAALVLGMDVTVASATITLGDTPPDIPYNSSVQVVTGTGPNNILRFDGLYKHTSRELWPYEPQLICRGNLSRADEFKQSIGAAQPGFVTSALNSRIPIVGISAADVLNSAAATDENYVVGVLSRVPNLAFATADIGGTGHVFSDLVLLYEMLWQPYVSALAQCQKFDEVCLGYRLFEGLGGRIMRTQVYGYPTNILTATFTEGIDILTAHGDRGIDDLINAVYVEGYAIGGKPGIINAFLQGSNPFQPDTEPHILPFNNPLIDDADFAAQVAQWKHDEGNRELVNVSFMTHRDDPIYPGCTIGIVAPHLATTEPVWLQHLEIHVKANPVSWMQIGRGVGGGLVAGVNYFPPPMY